MATRTRTARLCRIALAVGEREACRAGGCPFWEPGGAVLEGRCAVDRLDLDARPGVAPWLLELRARLDSANAADAARGRRELYALLDTGDADGG